MDYEKCKELRDAGFSQTSRDTICWDEIIYLDTKPGENSTRSASLPTLSELIEACGKDFGNLSRNGLRWVSEPDYGISMETDSGYGSTPEEAVANLYLALNKK